MSAVEEGEDLEQWREDPLFRTLNTHGSPGLLCAEDMNALTQQANAPTAQEQARKILDLARTAALAGRKSMVVHRASPEALALLIDLKYRLKRERHDGVWQYTLDWNRLTSVKKIKKLARKQ